MLLEVLSAAKIIGRVAKVSCKSLQANWVVLGLEKNFQQKPKSWFLSEALLSRMKVQQRQKPSAPTLSFVIFAGVIDGNASDPLVIDYA